MFDKNAKTSPQEGGEDDTHSMGSEMPEQGASGFQHSVVRLFFIGGPALTIINTIAHCCSGDVVLTST